MPYFHLSSTFLYFVKYNLAKILAISYVNDKVLSYITLQNGLFDSLLQIYRFSGYNADVQKLSIWLNR